jgi:hypothetical protein
VRWKIRRSLKWKRERAHLKMPKYLYICVVYDVIMIFSITNKKNKKQKKYLVELLQNLLRNYKSPTMIMILSRRLFDYIRDFFFCLRHIFIFCIFSICTQIITHYIYGIVLNYGHDQFYLFFCVKIWYWGVISVF